MLGAGWGRIKVWVWVWGFWDGGLNEELILIRNHFEIIADISFVQLDNIVCSSVQLRAKIMLGLLTTSFSNTA